MSLLSRINVGVIFVHHYYAIIGIWHPISIISIQNLAFPIITTPIHAIKKLAAKTAGWSNYNNTPLLKILKLNLFCHLVYLKKGSGNRKSMNNFEIYPLLWRNWNQNYLRKCRSRVSGGCVASCVTWAGVVSPWLDEDSRPSRAGRTCHRYHRTFAV